MNKGSVSLGSFLAAAPHGFQSRTSPGTVRFAAAMRMPDMWARTQPRASTAGMAALCGSVTPSDSGIHAIDGRHVAARGAHQQGRRGLVAADQQHHAVDRVAADRLFDVDARQVAREHRGRSQVRLAVAEDRELDRKTAGFEDAAFHVFGELAEVRVARCQLAPGVADADDRLALELVVRDALDIRCLPCSTPETAPFSMTTNET